MLQGECGPCVSAPQPACIMSQVMLLHEIGVDATVKKGNTEENKWQ